jgi:hypothetical protein
LILATGRCKINNEDEVGWVVTKPENDLRPLYVLGGRINEEALSKVIFHFCFRSDAFINKFHVACYN